jgi:uncharacterized protein (PEP-CTERM system associated)
MNTQKQNKSNRPKLKNARLAGVGIVLTASVATAQIQNPEAPLSLKSDYLGYAASVSTRASYSDNINLEADGLRDDEVILSTLFTGGVIFSKPQATILALGDLDLSYLTDASDFVVNQNIGVASTFTLDDNWLYFDASGHTSRQILGDNARYSGNINAARGQRANVHSYSVSPYLFHRMADQSAVELRYRLSQVFIDDDNAAANLRGGDFLNNSSSHEATASYESGGLYDRVRFRLVAYGNITEEFGSDQLPEFAYEQGSVLFEPQVALNRSLFLSGAVGYDEIDAKSAAALFFDDSELSGVFWRGGITAQPGRRSRLRVEYGERFGDDFIDADAFYELSRRFVVAAGANRAFQSRAQGVDARFRGSQTQVLDFADRLREGQELSPRAVIDAASNFADVVTGRAAQTVGLGIADRAFASLSAFFDRTQVTLGANYENSDYGFRTIEAVGGGLDIRHRLSRRLNIYGGADFRRADTSVDADTCAANPILFGLDPAAPLFDPMAECVILADMEGRANTAIGRVGGTYSLYKNVSLFAEYAHTERFSENAALEYGENAATLGLTLDF